MKQAKNLWYSAIICLENCTENPKMKITVLHICFIASVMSIKAWVVIDLSKCIFKFQSYSSLKNWPISTPLLWLTSYLCKKTPVKHIPTSKRYLFFVKRTKATDRVFKHVLKSTKSWCFHKFSCNFEDNKDVILCVWLVKCYQVLFGA